MPPAQYFIRAWQFIRENGLLEGGLPFLGGLIDGPFGAAAATGSAIVGTVVGLPEALITLLALFACKWSLPHLKMFAEAVVELLRRTVLSRPSPHMNAGNRPLGGGGSNSAH